MKKYIDVRGCSVVDEKGNLYGRVEDSLLDIKKLKIPSFIVLNKNIISNYNLLLLKDIEKYDDVIVIKNRVYSLKRYSVKKFSFVLLNNYIGKEILDLKGKIVGILDDIIFDEFNGDIKALILKRGFFEDLFDGRKVIIINEKTNFGKEKIIVDDENIDITNSISFKNFIR